MNPGTYSIPNQYYTPSPPAAPLPPPPLEYYVQVPNNPFQYLASVEYNRRLASGIPTSYPHPFPSPDPATLEAYWQASVYAPPPLHIFGWPCTCPSCQAPPQPQLRATYQTEPQLQPPAQFPPPPALVPTPAATPSPRFYNSPSPVVLPTQVPTTYDATTLVSPAISNHSFDYPPSTSADTPELFASTSTSSNHDNISDTRTFLHHLDMAANSADLHNAIAELGRMTVDNLKRTLKTMNDQLGTGMRVSGNKTELYDRIKDEVYRFSRQDQYADKFRAAKNIISSVYNGTAPSPASSTSGSVSGGYSNAQPQAYNGAGPSSYTASGLYGSGYGSAPAPSRAPAPSNSTFYKAPTPTLPPPRFGSQSLAHQHPSQHAAQSGALPIKFRTSPFYNVEKAVSTVTMLPQAKQGDRKNMVVNFFLTAEQRTMLLASKASPANPQYQIRLYCTNEEHYQPSRPGPNQPPAPTDYPATCEIKLNGFTVTGNTKGIKKQVGTAPPVDLSSVSGGNALNLGEGGANKVEVIWVNTEKKYFVIVYLIRTTTVKAVVETIKKGKYRAKEDVVEHILKLNSDPDVEATSYGLSLKDPLTFSRIKNPIRSINCNHIGCFEAETWFMMMEQTPSWLCPICNKTVKVDDITVDGYFDSILKACPSSVDMVTVEPDGTWRTSDNKYGTNEKVSAPDPKGKARASLTLDSDSEDDKDSDSDGAIPLKKKVPLPVHKGVISLDSDDSSASAVVAARKKQPTEVIDLTLSDDSEDETPRPISRPFVAGGRPSGPYAAPPLPPGYAKRRASDEMGTSGPKKSRMD